MRTRASACLAPLLAWGCTTEPEPVDVCDETPVDVRDETLVDVPDEAPALTAPHDVATTLRWLARLYPERYASWTVADLRNQAALDLSGFDDPPRFSSDAPKRVHRAIVDDDLRYLAPLVRLESLDLDRSEIRGDSIGPLRQLPRLRKLSLNASMITDAGVAEVARISTLTDLGLGHCANITAEGLQPLAALRNLERLELFENGTSTGWARYLAGLRQLRELSLSKTALNADDLEILGSLPELRRLDIRNSRLQDDEFAASAPARRLEELWLDGTGLSPAIVPALRRMDRLRVLGVPTSHDWPTADELQPSLGSVKIYARN